MAVRTKTATNIWVTSLRITETVVSFYFCFFVVCRIYCLFRRTSHFNKTIQLQTFSLLIILDLSISCHLNSKTKTRPCCVIARLYFFRNLMTHKINKLHHGKCLYDFYSLAVNITKLTRSFLARSVYDISQIVNKKRTPYLPWSNLYISSY